MADFPEFAFAVRIERRRVIEKKAMPIQVVNRANTLVVCDPKTLSVIPPPNADPNPSLRGRCMRTTKIINAQTRTWRAMRIDKIMDIREPCNLDGRVV